MPLNQADIDEWARRLAHSRLTRATRSPISAAIELSIADAYAIQRAGTSRRLARGERIVGWKLGYTSLAMREQMGIDQPNFGPLTDAMLLGSHDVVDPGLIHPRVEPEIGLRFARALESPTTVEDVLAAVDEPFACLEVVDSVFREYRFRLEDNTADGSSAAQVVIGPPLRRTDRLDEVTVELFHNGSSCASALGAAASGNPVLGVVWLVEQLAAQGLGIRAGDIVITGGLTAAVPLLPGDDITAVFDGSVEVAVLRPGRIVDPA